MSNELGWVYYDDALKLFVYRASSFGSCIRSLTASRLGETELPNQFLKPYLDASGDLEAAITKQLVAHHNVIPMWEQKMVELPVTVTCAAPDEPDNQFTTKVIIRGHIDLLDRITDDIVESKALGPNNFAKYDRGGLDALGALGDKYRMQGAVYGHATERNVRYAIGEKLRDEDTGEYYIGRVIYEPAVDPSDLVPYKDIEARIRIIEEHAAIDELPECDGGCSEGDPFSEVHLFASATDGGEELLALLKRYCEIKAIIGDKGDESKGKPATGLLGEQAEIKAIIEERFGEGKHVAGPYTARLSRSPGKEFVDGYWLKKHMPDVYEQALRRGRAYTQLVVTEKKARQSKGERDE